MTGSAMTGRATATTTSLRGFPARIGQLVVAPSAGVARVEAEGGGLRDALWLVVLGVLTFRLPELVRVLRAAAGPSSGELLRLVALFGDEARGAAWVVLPAAVIITVAAGRRRDASRDLDLGAACYAPYFALRSVARLVDGAAGMQRTPQALVDLVSAVGAVAVLAFAIRAARARASESADALPPPDRVDAAGLRPAESVARGPGNPPRVPTKADRRALLAGLGVLALSTVALAENAVWTARHYDALRPMRKGEPAPAFALPDIDHAETVSLAQFQGQAVLLDFWASWCGPCVAMMPTLDAVHQRWAGRGVAFLGINSDGGGATLEELKRFLGTHNIPYPVVIDDGSVGALYKVEALPSLIVIGRDGRIRQSFVGMTTERSLDHALEDATRD